VSESVTYRALPGGSGYWGLLAAFAAFAALALLAAHYMDVEGHHVTGMSNRIVWGMPHVFAVFLIVAASGALNVASMASVFDRAAYKPLARLSALLAVALLLGGLSVLVLDLGRPDRLVVAMTHYNFKSIFAWNIFLYTGFMVVGALYLWTMMERRMNRHVRAAGTLALAWRLVLTTGTGCIFGFLVARQAYDAAVMAPLFILMSFAFGLAVFVLVLAAIAAGTGRAPAPGLLTRLGNLLGVFQVAVIFLVAVFHVANLYVAEHAGVERFILTRGGQYTAVFWVGQVLAGTLAPLALLWGPRSALSIRRLVAAAVLVVLGGLSQIYVVIVGGQAYPLTVLPGVDVIEGGALFAGPAWYQPGLAELTLGVGGVAIAMTVLLIGLKVLPFLPERLDGAPAS
jgi:molybdopterin-containing oxidoreductase family membrane subunit